MTNNANRGNQGSTSPQTGGQNDDGSMKNSNQSTGGRTGSQGSDNPSTGSSNK